MRARLVWALVAVATLAVALFAIPLAVQASRLDLTQAELELERDATRAAGQIPRDYQQTRDPVELPRTAEGRDLALYTPAGDRVLGSGPDRADPATRAALQGTVERASRQSLLVVAVPVSVDERPIGAIRAAMPLSILRADTAATWGVMALVALAALAVASAVGWRLATAMTTPVTNLADTTARIGAGDFTARAAPSRIPELHRAAQSLNDTAERLGDLVRRERTFSADASHQLHTPLTRLRLELEQAQSEVRSGHLDRAMDEAAGMVELVSSLLDLARDDLQRPQRAPIRNLFEQLRDHWHGSLAAAGRPLRIDTGDSVTVTASASAVAVGQILDVLLDNALRHGAGTVQVRVRTIRSAVAIDVHDEGPGIAGAAGDIFARRSSAARGHGIGLALARTLAEAEGGRLELGDPGPGPTFTVLLARSPAPDQDGRPPS